MNIVKLLNNVCRHFYQNQDINKQCVKLLLLNFLIQRNIDIDFQFIYKNASSMNVSKQDAHSKVSDPIIKLNRIKRRNFHILEKHRHPRSLGARVFASKFQGSYDCCFRKRDFSSNANGCDFQLIVKLKINFWLLLIFEISLN